jgi:YggT family protein
MNPSHPIQRTIGLIVEPLLAPIRRIVPPISGLDFSPLILIILLEVLARLLTSLLR